MNDTLKIWTTDVEGYGTFAFRHPTVKDVIEISRYRGENFLPDVKFEFDLEKKRDFPLGIDSQTLYLATCMSELIVCSEKTPKDFTFESCDDVELIIKLYEEFYDWRARFRTGQNTAGTDSGSQKATA